MILDEFLRCERDFSLSAAFHLHNASIHAGSPRTNPKHSKHLWIKLGVAWGSLVGRDVSWEIMRVGVRARRCGSWTGERLKSHE